MAETIYNFHQLNGAKGFKVVHINIRSLSKKIDQIRSILQCSTIDILTLSETWLHTKVDSQVIEIQGYTNYRLDREIYNKNHTKKRGGGLITFVKEGSMDVYVQDHVSTKDIEIQWLKIKRENSKTILIANVYRPPSGKVDQAIKLIEKGIPSYQIPNEETIIIGDFNPPTTKKLSFSRGQILLNKRSAPLLGILRPQIRF